MPPTGDQVTLTLAHPLSAAQVEQLNGQPAADIGAGEPVTVGRSAAAQLIHAGYAAGVDPADTKAVAAALANGTPQPAAAAGPAAEPPTPKT